MIGTSSDSALVILLAPAESPTTSANVLLLTLPGLFPPRDAIAAEALLPIESGQRSGHDHRATLKRFAPPRPAPAPLGSQRRDRRN